MKIEQTNDIAGTIVVLMLSCGIVAWLTGCSASMNQDFTMTGNAAGIRAFNDGLVGIARTAKEPVNKKNEYLGYREKQEGEITTRDTAPGLLGGLFAPKSQPGLGS